MKRRIFNIILSLLLLVTFVLTPVPANAAGAMQPSEDCVAVLKKIEGFTKYPVLDYTQYTVGYGTKCPDADLARYRSQGITQGEAEELLKAYLETMCQRLNKFASDNNLTLQQNQFDALVLFTYNVGTGWMSGTSDIKTAILTGASGNDLIYYLSRWCTADFKVIPGLVSRRLAEADLFLNGNYAASSPSYYSYVEFDPNEGVCASRVQGYDASDPPAVKAVATRTNFRFLGWYTAKENGQWITDLDTTTARKTLYARWQEGDGVVSDGVIQGTPCNYKRKVNSAEKLSVYEAPNASTPFAQLDSGITVKIVADYVDSAGAKWGKMEGGGWVNLGTTHQTVTPAAKTVQENVTVTVTGNNVNVRSGAGATYTLVGQVNSGDKLVICETKMVGTTKWGRYSGGWLSLDYTDYGKSSDSEQTEGTPASASGTVVNCTSLRIRSGAGTGYPAVGSVAKGQRVEITEIKTVGAAVWGKTAAGWICLSYVQLDKPLTENAPPVQEEAPSTGTTEESSNVQHGTVVNCNSLNVRSGAGMSNKLVDSLKRGTQVEIYETQNAEGMVWGRIKQGWICMQYVQLQYTGTAEGKSGTVISSTALNIRATPSISGGWAGSLPSGSKVIVYETQDAGGMTWGKIDRGWVCMTYVRMDEASDENSTDTTEPETSTETISAVVSVEGSLRIRMGAGTHTAQVGLLSNGTAVTIYETTMVDGIKWGRIDKGWICMNYVKLGDEPAGNLGTVRADSLNIRSAPGTNNPVVGSYSQGTQIEILETVTVGGIPWGRTKQGWVSLNYVKQ